MSEATSATPLGAVTAQSSARAEAPVPAHRSAARVSGRILVSSQGLGLVWHSEKLFLPLKRGMGGQRIEVAAVEPNHSRHSHSIWCRTEWAAWKSSVSDPPGSTFVLGL